MKEQTEKKDEKKEAYLPPKGSVTSHSCRLDGRKISFTARAEWLILRKKDKPHAEMFHIAYLEKAKKPGARPITFIFNGGPGAASAYLHMGAIGPKRAVFNSDGSNPKPPLTLTDNAESWLSFSDLVFIDPIGTGFSRMIKEDVLPRKENEKEGEKWDEKEFYKLNRDLESLGEFVSKFLSKHNRWESPVFIAGESYGGFRTACMAKRLQEGFGVGLNGVIIISPALEFLLLDPSDYDLQGWMDLFPTMAAAAAVHGRSGRFKAAKPVGDVVKAAEEFAATKLYRLLSQGDALGLKEREGIISEMSSFIGIPEDYLKDAGGRIRNWTFCRKLLKDRGLICGLYDASITAVNPFPDREWEFGPDPTLSGMERVFTAGINTHLRGNLALACDRDYQLLNEEVNKDWQDDRKQHFFMRQIGATDELRYGMALNPHMKVFIAHGCYDLVTPYYTSSRLVEQLRLAPSLKKNIEVKRFRGGHMFYTWEESRKAFKKDMAAFYRAAV